MKSVPPVAESADEKRRRLAAERQTEGVRRTRIEGHRKIFEGFGNELGGSSV